MTSAIRAKIDQQEQNIQQVVRSIENIQIMSAQVKQSNIEQNTEAIHIQKQMEGFAQQLTNISDKTQQLQESSDQIVEAMRKIDSITENILHNTTTLSEHTVNKLVQQSDALREGLTIFKVN
jgi:methyl-accepting chemotaxis protein